MKIRIELELTAEDLMRTYGMDQEAADPLEFMEQNAYSLYKHGPCKEIPTVTVIEE